MRHSLTVKVLICVGAIFVLSTCGDLPPDRAVDADVRAVIKEYLADAVDMRSLDHTVVDGGRTSLELYAGVVLQPKLNSDISSGPFQGLSLQNGVATSRITLHLFYKLDERDSTWRLYAFSVTLPGRSERGPVWEWPPEK